MTGMFSMAKMGRMLILAAGATSVCVWAISNPPEPQAGAEMEQTGPRHMPEEVRSSLRKIVVLPIASPADQAVTGDYKNATKGFAGGMASGSEIGKGIQTEVGGIPVGIPFPILTMPGALVGGISGFTKREIQEFRDGLTRDLAEASSQPLTNDAIASDVFWGLKKVPTLEPKLIAPSTPVSEDTDAILYVSLSNITIDVQGKEAIITTSANATLRRLRDGSDVYIADVKYQDRDTLSNWNENDHALWHDYVNFAKHYLGREISAELFDRVELQLEIKPAKSATIKKVKKNDWVGISKTSTPTLAWELKLLGGNDYGPWASEISAANISYDVEIYDMDRLVYAANRIPNASHTVVDELEPCKTYRWSVRPSYSLGADHRFGEWMRSNAGNDTGNGGTGKAASVAPAYIYDFASLEIKCRRK